ncbi:MAG TPA: hypothetical protein VNI01_03835, partial [Elusimicrobiota bacterium]|nr:hypothetical protein [Elusimicrobiota bacterium]
NFIFVLPGAVAAIGVLGSASVVFHYSSERAARKPSGPLFDGIADLAHPEANGKLAKLETMLAQRDFIYLLVVLAAVDRLEEFLWAAGVGTPLFFVILLYLKKSDARRQPA